MSNALIGLLSTLLATNQPAALSNLIAQNTGISVSIPDPNDPVEKEFRRLMAEDDAAQDEVDTWIVDAETRRAQGDSTGMISLKARMNQRFDKVRKGYTAFISRHPGHVGARLAYGSFLSDLAEEHAAFEQFQKAADLDPKNPAAWNNLANYHGHNGSPRKAFECYGKALALKPLEAVYYQNLATVLFAFRRDATNYFHTTLDDVFAKSLALYRRALELDPGNFLLASDLAMTYYGIPAPQTANPHADQQARQRLTREALAAWETCLKLARNDKERQGVHVHFARVYINANRFAEARHSLAQVVHPDFDLVKTNLLKKLASREHPPPPPAVSPTTR
ncbi:MAG: tetratricopeptide repeat protein [Verrucomicrobia bacterium]|nr:tetratricopeptide repeat protein [Verrucomicrobiota bacterium]